MKKLFIFILFSLPLHLLQAQQLLQDFGNNHISTSSISFTADSKYFLVSGYARSYSLDAGKLDFRTLEKDTETQGDFSFRVDANPSGSTFILSKLGKIEVWDLRGRKRIKDIRDSRLVEVAICYSEDGKSILYMRKNGELVIIDASTYKEVFVQKVTDDTPSAIKAAHDGKTILIATRENSLILFDPAMHTFNQAQISERGITHIDLTSSGDYISLSTSEGRIWLGRFPSMDMIQSWQAHSEGNTDISFHPSGRYLLSGGKDKKICIWSIPECSLVTEWEAHKYPIMSVAFAPDGQRLVSGAQNDVLLRGGDDTRIWSFGAPGLNQVISKTEVKIPPPVTMPVKAPPADVSYNRKLALVIGNGNYLNGVLANPENDARAMRDALRQYGFDVIEHENLNQTQMKKAMDEFGEALKSYDVGLFFYAGHGMQSKGYNYLIPVDADIKSEEQVEYDCVQADRVLALMEASGAKINIIILDACRNNPFERSWTRAASGRGLAFMNAPEGTLIAYATAPGSTASDGSGNNGLYTSAILESIRIPNISILQMFQNVRSIVSQQSNRQQIPWESTSLIGDFYFNKTEIK